MSQFLKNTESYNAEPTAGIEFDDAVKLSGGGSTCDIYRTRWQRRDVFVKRLKEEYRFKPIYLDALDKEFDVGVNLKHPSLPEYREFNRDYIVMDYIDGVTLAEMIARKDPWLTKERNIISMLRKLVDVVGYLHRHNIVHCDIKADNIMITSNTRNLVLIDFDKSYTYSLGDTSGDPAKYGLTTEEKGHTTIDFRGIGMVVEKLQAEVPGVKFHRCGKFVKACYRPDANSETLTRLLDYNPTSFYKSVGIAVALVAISLMILFAVNLFKPEEKKDVVRSGMDDVSESTLRDTVVISQAPAIEDKTEPRSVESPVLNPVIDDDREEVYGSPINDTIDATSSDLEILDAAVRPYFTTIIAGLDKLDCLRKDKSMSGDQLADEWIKYQRLEARSLNEMADIVSEMSEQYPDVVSQNSINSTKSCMAYLRRANSVKKKYLDEIDRRSGRK